MAELYLIAQLGALRPVDDEGKSFIAKKQGKTLRCEVTEPRNAGHHRKFFAMVNILVENSSWSKDEIVNLIKLGIGHVHVCQTPKGYERWPASISWANMDDTGFRDFYDRSVNWVLQELFPHLERGALDAEVEERLMRF